MEYIELESVPANEPCQIFGAKYSPELARVESNLFALQIARQFPGFDKVKIQVKTHYGDYTCHFVRIGFDPNCPESVRQAFEIEESVSNYWDDESKEELKQYAFERAMGFSDRVVMGRFER